MRRILSWLIMVPALAAVVIFALNNKQSVALDLWPFSLLIEMPVYLALLLALALGALVGGTAAWLGQGRVRSKLRDQAYEGEVARRELIQERERALTLERELDKRRVHGEAGADTGHAVVTVEADSKPQNAA